MKMLLMTGVVLSFAFVSHVGMAWGGFEEGLAAYKAGNFAAAFKEWKPLAEHGHSKAQYNVGVLYEKGKGVRPDPVQALAWYQRAAAQGEPFAQNNLGTMYEMGRPVPRDYVKADMWYLLSGRQGNAVATKNHEKLVGRMTKDQAARARKLADEWKPAPSGGNGNDRGGNKP